jgi:hypothetical protein
VAPPRPALVAFAVVLGGGVVLGETFPFSRFSMYAGIEPRDRGATPVFLADGEIVPVEQFDAFQLEVDAWRSPEGIPTTMDYLTNDIAGWIRAHPSPVAPGVPPAPVAPGVPPAPVAPGVPPGCVRAELGWVISTRGDDGAIAQSTLVQSSGTACRR